MVCFVRSLLCSVRALLGQILLGQILLGHNLPDGCDICGIYMELTRMPIGEQSWAPRTYGSLLHSHGSWLVPVLIPISYVKNIFYTICLMLM